MTQPPTLTDLLPDDDDPDAVFAAFAGWTAQQGFSLYPHQEEALIEIVSGANVILSAPTGSGKSLVATGAHFTALARDDRTFYTAPIKALVSEKFFALCDIFGADEVGMMTGDGSVNRDRADHLLHSGDTGEHRAAGRCCRRRRPGRDGRVPLLRRPRSRLGLAGAADRVAAGAVRPHVRDPRGRQHVRAGPDPAYRPPHGNGEFGRAPRSRYLSRLP